MIPTNIKGLQNRSRRLRARRVDRQTLVVESASNPAANHVVMVRFYPDGTLRARCTCPWAHNRGVACVHVMAALEYLAARKNRTLSFWPSRTDAARQKHRMFYLRGTSGGGDNDGVWITSRPAA
jgi:hypothetical protein